MLLEFLPQAELDLEVIGDYIASDNPRQAVRFIQQLRSQCERIARNPLGYRLRPECGEHLRSCAYGNYVIFFTERKRKVQVVRVLHGAMDLDAQFGVDI